MTRSLYQSGFQPRGTRKDWERTSMGIESTAKLLGEWAQGADVTDAVAWFGSDDSLRVLVADLSNEKRITLRSNGRDWRITYDRQPLTGQPQQQAHQPTGARAEGGANK